MEEIDLREYLQIVLSRRRFIIAISFGLALVTFVGLKLCPRSYEGSARLIFPKASESGPGLLSQLGALQGVADIGGNGLSSPGMYTDILTSRRLSENVIRELDLSEVDVTPEDLQESMRLENTKSGGLQVACYASTKWVKSKKLEWLDSIEELQNASVDKKTAYLASRMTNTYLKELQNYDELHALSTGRRHRVFLHGEVEKTKHQLNIAEEVLRHFREKHPVLAPPETSSEQVKQVIELRKMQIEAASELSDAARSVEEAKSAVADQKELVSAAKIIQENPVVSTLKLQLADAEVHKAELLENMTEKHPDVVAASDEIEKLREKIKKEVTSVVQNETIEVNPVRQALIQEMTTLDIKRSGIQARVSTLNESMAGIEKEISADAKSQLEYVRLFRDVKALEGVYASLLTEYSKAKVEEAKEPEGFTVLDEAVPQKYPAKPRVKLAAAAAFMLGLFGSSFAVILQEFGRGKKRMGKSLKKEILAEKI